MRVESMKNTSSILPCSSCGVENYHIDFTPCEEKSRMDSEGVCFTCAFWLGIVDRKERHVIIAGWCYQIGEESRGSASGFSRGFAGRRFDIQLLEHYREGSSSWENVITTHNLWCQGEIPVEFRENLPDTAKFVRVAKKLLSKGIA